MTDKKAAKEADEGKVPATTSTPGLPADLASDVMADAGAGMEQVNQDDMSIPFLRIAQALSPEVNKREGDYIEGIEVGDIFNTATQAVWKGDAGFPFIPAYYVREYLEWVPREQGGGFAGRHPESIMSQTSRNDKGKDVLPNGHHIVTTGTWYGLVVTEHGAEQAVISMASTQLKKSRQLMTKLKSLALPKPGGQPGTFNPPLFYNALKVTSVPEQNDQGNWMGWKFDLVGSVFDLPNGAELYKEAKALMEAVKSGAVKAATPPADGASQGDDNVPF